MADKPEHVIATWSATLGVSLYSPRERDSRRAFGTYVGGVQTNLGPMEFVAFGNYLEIGDPKDNGMRCEIDIRPLLSVALDMFIAAKAGNVAALQLSAPIALYEKIRALLSHIGQLAESGNQTAAQLDNSQPVLALRAAVTKLEVC